MARDVSWKTVSDEHVRSVSLEEAGRHPVISKGFLVLKYVHDSAEALLSALLTVRQERHARRGALTDEEQDLLRAMLVTAASGLDSMVKRLILAVLPPLCDYDEDVLTKFQEHVVKKLKGDVQGNTTADAAKFLARVLTDGCPRETLIEDYVYELTGSSMQSASQLYKAANALGIGDDFICRTTLTPIFSARNQIIHELDINFEEARRNRRSRRKGRMIKSTNQLLALSEVFYLRCEEKLFALDLLEDEDDE